MTRRFPVRRAVARIAACAACAACLVPFAGLAWAQAAPQGSSIVANTAKAVLALRPASVSLHALADEDGVFAFEVQFPEDESLVYSGGPVVPTIDKVIAYVGEDGESAQPVELAAGTGYDAESAVYAPDDAEGNETARLDANGKPVGAGDYTVTLAGKGVYAVESEPIVGHFSIERADLEAMKTAGKLVAKLYDGTVEATSFTFTGQPIEPSVKLYYNGAEVDGAEYDAEIAGPYVNAGAEDAVVQVNAATDGDFKDSIEVPFTIAPAEQAKLIAMADDDVLGSVALKADEEMSLHLACSVDGTRAIEAPTVDLATVQATSDNLGIASVEWSSESGTLSITGVAAGDAKVTVTGSAEESANLEKTALEQLVLDVSVSSVSSETTYAITYDPDPGAIPDDAPKQFAPGESVQLPEATCATRTFVGWYDEVSNSVITSIPAGSDRDFTLRARWLNNLKSVDIVGADEDSFTYTGDYIDPEVIVYDADGDVVPSDSFEKSVTNNKDATDGALITVTAKQGSGYSGEAQRSFRIVSADTTDLIALIVMMRDELDNYQPSADNGRDVPDGKSWVSQQDYDAFKGAINDARSVTQRSSISQADVDAASASLLAAQEAFEKAIKTAEVDFSELAEALANGTQATEEIEASADGRDVPDGAKWATKAQLDACLDAIEAGDDLISSSTATQNDVDAAVKAIKDANDALVVHVAHVDKSAAQAAYDAGNKLEDGGDVWSSEDGLDVPNGVKWAPLGTVENYENALLLLEEVLADEGTTQQRVDGALQTFRAADEKLVVRTAVVDTTSLEALVRQAESLMDGVEETESKSANNFPDGTRWVTPDEMWEIEEPLLYARDVLDADEETRVQAEVNDALEDLQPAVSAFGRYIKTVGGKSVSPDPVVKTAATVWGRLQGDIALDTMASIVRAGDFATGESVVLTTFDGYWDALTAAGLAGFLDAPVLMTAPEHLSSQTAALLKELEPSTIFVAGGTAALPDSTVSLACAAAGSGATSVRVAGATATGTAVEIYRTVSEADLGSWSRTAFVATNVGYWDALAAAPIAYAAHMPIFLTEGADELSAETLAAMKGNVSRVYIVGGTAAVSPHVEQQLVANGIQVAGRLAGERAVETSERVAEYGLSLGMTANKLGVATVNGYWDALAGSALCGRNESVLVLVNDASSSSIAGFVKSHAGDIVNAYVFGGSAAVGDAALSALRSVTPAP